MNNNAHANSDRRAVNKAEKSASRNQFLLEYARSWGAHGGTAFYKRERGRAARRAGKALARQ